MARESPEYEPLYTTGEVAKLFRVDAASVTRWGNEGRIEYIKTPSGQRRYPKAMVLALLTPDDRSAGSETESPPTG
ncbi:helix-turn-helix domain-containing protein [Actinomadura graeca]|uniref:Helix-turn-helix domain-containing protein n=1 Tax=Actinomadura graeca TaxID=2750812 RepID=A0ABX8QUF5_9ACTN|nr:helix-turn-helix domain-containing protein [Actinomadura graeca]QXJ21367.1 helix-turn-helix domain-containing protein [Actinomadura graeca]